MRVVIGVDSGGSTTRALAVTLEGRPVAYAEGGGGNPSHDAASRDNVRKTIERAAEGYGAVRIVAGVAGFNGVEDEARLAEATAGFPNAARVHLNDAAVAHHAAFGEGPGIVSIQGTGSTIRARLEDGWIVNNGEFMHYARGGAVWVGIEGVHTLLTSLGAQRDTGLWQAAYELWGADSPEGLREALARQRELEAVERSRRHGTFARAVTASAEAGWLHSLGVCYRAAREIGVGVRLLGPMFGADEVRVALVGSCGRSAPIRDSLGRYLAKSRDKRYAIVEAAVPPVVGAVQMALEAEGVFLGPEALRRLAEYGLENPRTHREPE